MNVILQYLIVSAFLLLCLANSFHGGAYLAVAGKDSVVLATDSRFSSMNPVLLGSHPRLLFRVGTKTIVGCYGLDAHVRLLVDELRSELENIRDSELEPANIAKLISNIMYKMPLQLSPLVAGVDSGGKPFICTMDGIGACTISEEYGVVGTSTSGLFTMCESLYQCNLTAEECVDLAERCMRMTLSRDVLSGSDIRIVSLLSNGNMYVKDVEISSG